MTVHVNLINWIQVNIQCNQFNIHLNIHTRKPHRFVCRKLKLSQPKLKLSQPVTTMRVLGYWSLENPWCRLKQTLLTKRKRIGIWKLLRKTAIRSSRFLLLSSDPLLGQHRTVPWKHLILMKFGLYKTFQYIRCLRQVVRQSYITMLIETWKWYAHGSWWRLTDWHVRYLADSEIEWDDSEIQSESDVPQNDAKRRSETWFFEIIVRLRHDQTFSDLLKEREHEQQIGSCLDSASDISWARSQTESETPGTLRLEGFVHDGSSNKITLNSLKRLFPEGEFGGNDWRWRNHKDIVWGG